MKFVGRRRSAKPFRTWLKNLCFYKSDSFEYLLACLFVCLFRYILCWSRLLAKIFRFK